MSSWALIVVGAELIVIGYPGDVIAMHQVFPVVPVIIDIKPDMVKANQMVVGRPLQSLVSIPNKDGVNADCGT